MAQWAKPKIFYKTIIPGTSFLAGTTESDGDYDVDYLHNWLEGKFWKASNTSPVNITLNAGSALASNYIAIIGHNLNTIGATIALEYSTTGAWAGEELDAFPPEAVNSDTVYLKEFDIETKQYWRLKITGSLSAAPFMSICVWGESVELDYASNPFDPMSRNKFANVVLILSPI